MMTYLKHVGNFKHSELKSKKFEDIQAMYEKIKRSDEDFIAIGSVEDDRLITKMNKKDSSKGEEIKQESKEEVKEEDKGEENTRKRKHGTRKKMKSRKRRFKQDTSQDDPSDIEKENDELRLCLTIATDEDKEVDYEILDKKVHTLMTDEGLVIHMLIEKKYPLKKEIVMQMLKLKLESEEESTMALELIRFIKKSWLVQDQTVLGKDYSNLLIADSLLKTIWFINAPCYDNEALASPNTNDEELSIPEQTATGKGTSNPLMAGCKDPFSLSGPSSKISFNRIPESLCKDEKGIKNDIEPIAPTMTVNRLVLEWEEKIKLHQEKEMEFDRWRNKNFKNERPAPVKIKDGMDDEGEVT
ncbi:hypothetical protein Tco_1325659 [Tanacetum coccineum]